MQRPCAVWRYWTRLWPRVWNCGPPQSGSCEARARAEVIPDAVVRVEALREVNGSRLNRLRGDLAQSIEQRSRLLMTLLFMSVFAMAALAVVDYGFLPPDDALRHAATATSEGTYADVLVFDPSIPVTDSTPGWHRFLAGVHHQLGLDKFGLVSFSIFFLFMVVSCSGLFLFQRPEAWGMVVALSLALQSASPTGRWLLGRPFLLVCAATAIFCLLWDRLREDETRWHAAAACMLVSAVTVWLHSTWFLLLAVPAVSVFSGDRRATMTLGGAILTGAVLGAALTLDPVRHLSYPIVHTFQTMNAVPVHFRVSELQGGGGFVSWLLAFGLFIVARSSYPELQKVPLSHPAFLLFAVAWVLSFKAVRFMTDLGFPALMAGLALLTRDTLDSWLPRAGLRRWVVAGGLAAAALWSTSANTGRRWESNQLQSVVWFQENPEEASEWLPGPGGVLYSPEMATFFNLYFTYPDANWKYILGLEQAIMPKDDLRILHDIWDEGRLEAYAPWVEKLRPEDRIFIRAVDIDIPAEWGEVETFQVPRSFLIVRRSQTESSESSRP